MVTQPGRKNPNWKGGWTVTSEGYVLIKAPTHPRADTRGYVYEHRLHAEEMLGRALFPGERVSFRNGDKTDTSFGNLVVRARIANEAKRADKIRRATLRKRGVEPVPREAKEYLIEWSEGVCSYCNELATCFDHVRAVAKGGRTEPGNILPACAVCNGSKHSRDVVEWLESTGRRPPVQTLEFLAFHGHLDEVLA